MSRKFCIIPVLGVLVIFGGLVALGILPIISGCRERPGASRPPDVLALVSSPMLENDGNRFTGSTSSSTVAAPAASAPKHRHGSANLLLTDEYGKILKLLKKDVRIRVFESDCAMRLLPRVQSDLADFPIPPLTPFPGQDSSTLTGGTALLVEHYNKNERKVTAFDLSCADQRKYEIEVGTEVLKVIGKKNVKEAEPDLALYQGRLVYLDVSAGKGNPVAEQPLEAADLGAIRGGAQPFTFEMATEAPDSGYGPVTFLEGHVYALRLADGRYAKITPRFVSSYVRKGQSYNSVLLDWVYQSDGSRRLAPNWVEVSGGDVEHEEVFNPGIQVALVVDNSGSEQYFLDDLKRGLQDFLGLMDPTVDMASLIRVSTESDTLHTLSSDTVSLGNEVGGLWVSAGWTALFDGIRLGNESLADGYDSRQGLGEPDKNRAVVVFTDGKDNNSSDEKDTKYPGDGIDTAMEDCFELSVGGVRTPVYTIALGEADSEVLEAIASESGGKSYGIGNEKAISRVYRDISETMNNYRRIRWKANSSIVGSDSWARRTALILIEAKVGRFTYYVTAYTCFGRGGLLARWHLRARKRLALGGRPRFIALSSDGKKAYVSNYRDNTISVIDLTHEATPTEVDLDGDPATTSPNAPEGITRLEVGRGPAGLAVTPDGGRLLVANSRENTVSVVNLASLREIDTDGSPSTTSPGAPPGITRITVWACPFGMVMRPGKPGVRVDKAYVANRFSDRPKVSVIYLEADPDPIDPIPKYGAKSIYLDHNSCVSKHPTDLCICGGELWVACGYLSKDSDHGTVTRCSFSESLGEIPVGKVPFAIDGADPYVYVANRRSGTVSVIDTTARVVVAELTVGKNPSGIAVDPAGRYIYVANSGDDTISVIECSGSSWQVLNPPLDAGNDPAAIAVGSTVVYTVDQSDDDLCVNDRK
jgi:YVTN family beta-propeller protein